MKIDEEYDEIGVRSFGRGIFHKERVSGASLGDKRVFRIEPGDLVISNVFAWEGAIALASSADLGRIGSHRFMTFVPLDHRLDASWARWFFLSEPGLELIGQASPGSAGRNRTLAIDRFEALEIPLPPIDEQRRMSDHLDQLATVEQRVRDRFSRASEIVNALLSSLASTEGVAVQLGELLEPISRPVILDPAVTYSLLGCRWYGDGLFVREQKAGSDVSASTLFEVLAGDLVYNRLFAWKGSFAIAGSLVEGCLVSGEFPVFRVDNKKVLPEFLAGVMRTPRFLEQVDARSSGSTPTSRNRLKERDFLRIEVTLPTIVRQQRVSESLVCVHQTKQLRERQQALQGALIPAALNEAFAGLS